MPRLPPLLPTSDIVFQYILGAEENKDLLLSFINAVLLDKGFPEVKDVVLKNPFSLDTWSGGKLAVLDVRAVDEEGRIYDIEIQKSDQEGLVNRFLFYWARLYAGQLRKGKAYHLLKPVICINVLTFRLFEEFRQYHSCFVLKELSEQSEQILTEHLQLHYVELPKLRREPGQARSVLERWLQFFDCSDEKQWEDAMKILAKDPVIGKAHRVFRTVTAQSRARELHEARLKQEWDIASWKYEEREKGRREGLLEGELKGELKGKQEAARRLLALGVDEETVAKGTGLPLAQVRALRRNGGGRRRRK